MLLFCKHLVLYNGTFLLRTFWDSEFLVSIFCCTIEVKNVSIRHPVGTKNFVLIMDCVLNSGEFVNRGFTVCM